jgi:hypothetical protein
MEFSGRKENDFMAVNFLDIIHSMNNEHPIKEVFQNLLEEQPKELIGQKITKLS